MKIFQRVQEIWRGHESVMDGQRGTDGLTKAIHIIPSPLLSKRLTKSVFVLRVWCLLDLIPVQNQYDKCKQLKKLEET